MFLIFDFAQLPHLIYKTYDMEIIHQILGKC